MKQNQIMNPMQKQEYDQKQILKQLEIQAFLNRIVKPQQSLKAAKTQRNL